LIPPIFVALTAPVDELRRWGRDLPVPRGVLVVGPDWQEDALMRSRGDPELAYELGTLLQAAPCDRRFADEPVAAMFPDVPRLRLSLVVGASPRRLFSIGRALGPLAARGYLVAGVGATAFATSAPAEALRELDAWIANLLADGELEELMAWRARAPFARVAMPDASRLDPLFVAAGAASLYEHAVGFPLRGIDGGASRRCVRLGR